MNSISQWDNETQGKKMNWQLVSHKRKGGKERSRIVGNNDEMNTNQSGEEDPVE